MFAETAPPAAAANEVADSGDSSSEEEDAGNALLGIASYGHTPHKPKAPSTNEATHDEHVSTSSRDSPRDPPRNSPREPRSDAKEETTSAGDTIALSGDSFQTETQRVSSSVRESSAVMDDHGTVAQTLDAVTVTEQVPVTLRDSSNADDSSGWFPCSRSCPMQDGVDDPRAMSRLCAETFVRSGC